MMVKGSTMMRRANRSVAACSAAVLLGLCSTSRAQVELVTNGSFETGDLSGWTAAKSDFGGGTGWTANNGSFVAPDEIAGPTPPISGSFDAFSFQNIGDSGGSRSLTSDVITVPSGVTAAVLSWSDRIRNWGFLIGQGSFSSQQEFRVQLVDAGGGVLADIYSTVPGDAPLQTGPNARGFDVTGLLQALAGQQIRIRFAQRDQTFFFNVNIDNVSLLVQTAQPDPDPDPVPDPDPDPDPVPDPEPEPEPELPIAIVLDVKPGSDDNPINLKNNGKSKGKSPAAGGVLPVAVLTTVEFDAASVDITRVALGDPLLEGLAVPIRGGAEDVDLDGDLDLILHFSILDMVSEGAIGPHTTSLCLGAYTLDGMELFGTDVVTIVPAAQAKAAKPPKAPKPPKDGKKKH
jgi:hypothetical protein